MAFFDIADIGIRVVPGTVNCLGRELEAFSGQSPNRNCVVELVVREEKEISDSDFLSSEVTVRSQNGRANIEGGNFTGHLDLSSLSGEVSLAFGDSHSFNLFLRAVYAWVLPQREGLVIHASSLIKDGRAYLFPGKSGVGKTTIVNLSPQAKILTDDFSLVRLEANTPVAYSTPFSGPQGRADQNTSAPLYGIYFPVKDKKNYLEELLPKLALRKLLSSMIFVGDQPQLMRKVFELSSQLVANLPCYDLHFLPQTAFWNCIHAEQS